MPINRNVVDPASFNPLASLPYELRIRDFESAMQDVYDFFYDVNASLARHSRVLTENTYFNGHPDLIVQGIYPQNAVKAGSQGVEIKTTRKKGGAVDTHGAREQWMCVFVYSVDNETEPASSRQPMTFAEVYLSHVGVEDFRRNSRGELGTRTATLDRHGIRKLRQNWLYVI